MGLLRLALQCLSSSNNGPCIDSASLLTQRHVSKNIKCPIRRHSRRPQGAPLGNWASQVLGTLVLFDTVVIQERQRVLPDLFVHDCVGFLLPAEVAHVGKVLSQCFRTEAMKETSSIEGFCRVPEQKPWGRLHP